jgi:dethiobiotin synthetase
MAESTQPGRGVWICGTDTGVGKTVVSSGLVRALASLGARVVGIKPVVSGAVHLAVEQDPRWEDLERLGLAGGVRLDANARSVYRFGEPAAPAFAAAGEGVRIDPASLVAGTRRLAASGEFAVVEGVGGIRVPLAGSYDTSHLMVDLGYPAVLVVGMRLGCINHALLSAEVLAARGVVMGAWVANLGLDRGYLHVEETVHTLEQALGMACAARLGALGGGAPLVSGVDLGDWMAGVERQIQGASLALGRLAQQLFHVKHTRSSGRDA